MLHKEHGKYMWDLEKQAIGEESRSHNNFLSACQVILYSSPPSLKGTLAASYHILLGQTLPSPPLILPQRTSPVEEQPTAAVSTTLVPKQSPRPKRWHPSPDSMESTPIGSATPKATSGGLPSPKRQEIPPWFKTLKPNCTKAFSQDSDMVKEARREYFSKHPCNFITDGNCDLSGTFKHLETSAGLLGTSIYKTQSPWMGPEELKQANYIFWCRFLILLVESWRIVVISGTVHWLYLKTSFHPLLWTSSGLTGSWKLSTYIRFGSLRSVKVLKLGVKEA